jgi:hypothetical protein
MARIAHTVLSNPAPIPVKSIVAAPVRVEIAVSVAAGLSGCVNRLVIQSVTSASTIPMLVARKNRKSGRPVTGSTT